ncbi:UPF0280 family protein [Shimia sediminis]|uniref:UPF0280 family protein n=1 Tax=Shimia sediminis TaxID=2497945 RepID=UPI000F8F553D|nr:UPF0280 family protein [Shimia sediminis]
MQPTAHILPDGRRLHLQHGPIDLIIGVDGQRDRAFAAATERFQTVLQELVDELTELRAPLGAETRPPGGPVAQRMHRAAMPFVDAGFMTRMIAVAGAVADEMLHAMLANAICERAYVNNGGDIALFLGDGATFGTAMQDHAGNPLGRIEVSAGDGVGGIATSGRHGRSHSLGIADSVTVLAKTAAIADVAATLCANAVDLPDHAAVTRRPASELGDQGDLGDLPVVVGCGPLTDQACDVALGRGVQRAQTYCDQTRIHSAALFLQGRVRTTGARLFALRNREDAYA